MSFIGNPKFVCTN